MVEKGEKKQSTKNLSRNLRSMKFMRRGENAIDLDAEASELKTRPEQWFRKVDPIEVKQSHTENVSISDCMQLRWGRASFGGFNKQLERLAEKMNITETDEDEELGEDIDAQEVSRRLKLIRSGKYKPGDDEEDEEGDDDMDGNVETAQQAPKKKMKFEEPEPECDTLHFKRPTMSVSFNLKGSDWAAQQQQGCSGDAAEYWSKLELYSKKKLWHQMTQVILEFVNSSTFSVSSLEFYTHFVCEYESKMNKLSLIEVIKLAVEEIQEITEAKTFLEKSKSKVSDCVMSTILLKIIGGAVELKLSDNRKAVKEVIEEVEKDLDGLGIVNPVHSRFYDLAANFYQLEADHGAYYRNSLKYLGVADINKMTDEMKQAKAFSIGISALLAKDVYNMGELLQHDILNSLQDSKNAWLIHLLQAFNCGDIKTFKSTSAQWQAQPDLKTNAKELMEKMCLMCMMEMTFVRPANDRAISFGEIAEKTNLRKQDVEMLVMRALSLGLVKGVIDEVDEKVHMTWVQPRVLNNEQIDRMRVRLDCWVREVRETEELMETHAQPILTH